MFPWVILVTVALLTEETSAFLSSSISSHRVVVSVLASRRSAVGCVEMAKGKTQRRKKKVAATAAAGAGQRQREETFTPVDADGETSGEEGGENVPRLVVMDLDYTLWHPELYQMRGSPFTKKKDGKVRDRSGVVIDLFPGVREALLAVHRDEERFRDTRLAIASRTSHERWAKEVMNLIELEPGLPMRSVFSFSEIYTGSKVRHFTQIRKNSGVPYEDMIFFDDWDQNCKDVGSLGVVCIECRRGLNRDIWTRGLANFAAAKEALRP